MATERAKRAGFDYIALQARARAPARPGPRSWIRRRSRARTTGRSSAHPRRGRPRKELADDELRRLREHRTCGCSRRATGATSPASRRPATCRPCVRCSRRTGPVQLPGASRRREGADRVPTDAYRDAGEAGADRQPDLATPAGHLRRVSARVQGSHLPVQRRELVAREDDRGSREGAPQSSSARSA